MSLLGTYHLLANDKGSDKCHKPVPKGTKQQRTVLPVKWLAVPAAVFFLWALLCASAALWSSQDVPFKSANRVLLVTAHPDDETIFFSPTISGILASGKRMYLMCLSTGTSGML